MAFPPTSKKQSTPYDVNFSNCLSSEVYIGGIYLDENKSREALYYMLCINYLHRQIVCFVNDLFSFKLLLLREYVLRVQQMAANQEFFPY